jgi:hypothetical protein
MYLCGVKKLLLFALFFLLLTLPVVTQAQCAMCTKTASQLGEKPALGLNNAILYLMLMPFAVIGVIAWRWWKNEKKQH